MVKNGKLSWCKNIKDRKNPNDEKMTPIELAQKLIQFVPLMYEDKVLEPFRGTGNFYNNFPPSIEKDWCEINDNRDYFDYDKDYDWIITNPPYSKIQKVLEKMLKEARKGFAILIGVINLTPKRLKLIEDHKFGITLFHICNVSGWFSNSVFLICERNKPSIISFTSKNFNMPPDEDKKYKDECKKYQEKYYEEKFKGKYKIWKAMNATEIKKVEDELNIVRF